MMSVFCRFLGVKSTLRGTLYCTEYGDTNLQHFSFLIIKQKNMIDCTLNAELIVFIWPLKSLYQMPICFFLSISMQNMAHDEQSQCGRASTRLTDWGQVVRKWGVNFRFGMGVGVKRGRRLKKRGSATNRVRAINGRKGQFNPTCPTAICHTPNFLGKLAPSFPELSVLSPSSSISRVRTSYFF